MRWVISLIIYRGKKLHEWMNALTLFGMQDVRESIEHILLVIELIIVLKKKL